ncbi:LOW QUALITY PROTEIN: Hypothetical protein PHPALM_5738, partial [Phytophthora palmivora]
MERQTEGSKRAYTQQTMSTSVYQFVSNMTPRFAKESPANQAGSRTEMAILSFQSSDCQRRFTRRHGPEGDLATATGEKAFVAPARVCGKRLTTTSNLTGYPRLHDDQMQAL